MILDEFEDCEGSIINCDRFSSHKSFMCKMQGFTLAFCRAHEVNPGNTAETKTLMPMDRGLLARYPFQRVVLIADRG